MFDIVHEPVPAGLDQMTPGPTLGALLASIDVDRVSGHDRVVVLRAQQRMARISVAAACQASSVSSANSVWSM